MSVIQVFCLTKEANNDSPGYSQSNQHQSTMSIWKVVDTNDIWSFLFKYLNLQKYGHYCALVSFPYGTVMKSLEEIVIEFLTM